MTLKPLLILTALTLLVPAPFAPARSPAAQQPAQTAEEKEGAKEEAKKELERKALEMLEAVVGDARTLRVPENRVRILAGAADLLWPRDEKRARALFREALGHVNDAAARASSGDSERRQRVHWSVVMLREEMLTTVARRDPSLALELLHATRQTPPPFDTSVEGNQMPDAELRLENQLAAKVAAGDPKRALQMAEDSLAKGLSFETPDLARRLQDADAEAGKKFAAEVVRKIRSENLSRNRNALYVAARMLDLARAQQAGTTSRLSLGGDSEAFSGKPLELDAQAARDLTDVLVTAVLAGRGDEYLLHVLGPRMQEIEKQWPERAALLRNRMAEQSKNLDPESRAWSRYAPLWEQDSPEPFIEAAAKAPPRMRGGLYTGAAWKAAGKGDFDRARQILSDNVPDSSERARLLDTLNNMALVYALRQGKLEDARQLVSQVRSRDKRAAALAQLALLAAAGGNKKLAQELLNEARPLAGERPRNVEQLNLHLQLARAYALVEPARSFEIVEAIIDRANEMIAAADVLDGFLGGPEIFRSGELVMHSGMASLEMIFQQYGKELAELARADFERAAAAAARFQRTEVRTMARLLIAQGLLSDRQPKGPSPETILAGGLVGVSIR